MPAQELRFSISRLAMFAEQTELFDHRRVADRVDDSVFAAVVTVFMPMPAWDRENVRLRPIYPLVVNDGVPFPLGTYKDGVDILPMR